MAKKATRKENPYAEEGFSVRRVPYTGHDGCKRKSRHWYIRFKDHRGKWQQLKGFTDKTASVRFARKLVKLVGYRATNERPDAELSKWVDELPDAVREKLIEWHILDKRAIAASDALHLHTEDWWKSIIHNKRTTDHADTSLARVDKLIKGCGFRRFADIEQLAIEDWLSCNVDSLGTRNHYTKLNQDDQAAAVAAMPKLATGA